MEGPGEAAAPAQGLAGFVSTALARTEAWYYAGAVFLFYAYPFVVLAWTALEGAAAARGREPPAHKDAFRRCHRRCSGAAGRKSTADKLQQGCRADGEGAGRAGAKAPRSRAGGLPGWLWGLLACAAAAARGLNYAAVLTVLALRLVVYSLLLSPWFLHIGYTYFHNPRIRRGIRYGSNPRNYVDIYFPTDAMAASESAGAGPKVPVVVTVMGGAWVIGHRLWNVLLGLRLSQAGVLVVGVDYRNFPQAEMSEMMEDVDHALDWVFANIAGFHGDPNNVVLIGQSAGAHLEATLLLQRCMAEARGEDRPHGWSPRDLKGFFGVSGPYDLVALGAHLATRGIYNVLPHLCAGRDLTRYSPMHVLASSEWRAVAATAAAKLPPVFLFAGELDQSVPAGSSAAFARALRAAGAADVGLEVGAGVRHAEPVVEDPLTGGDMQIGLLLHLLPEEVRTRLETLKPPYCQVPRLLAKAALRIMPF